MVDIVQKWCGQIIFLPVDNFALNCEFCQHDFYTLEDFCAHLNEHFPELTTTIKNEDSIECGSDCESIPLDVRDDMKDILIDKGPGSETTVAAEYVSPSAFNNKKPIESEQSVGNQQKRQPQRTCKKKLSSKIGNISRPIVHEESRFKPAKSVRKFVPLDDTKRKCSAGKEYSTEQKIITSTPKKCLVSRVAHDKRHKCSVCGKSFVTPATLDYHTREKHLPDSDSRRYFVCQQCDVKCKTYQQLVQHRKIHQENPNFTCDYCQKKFEFKRRMLEHIRNHFGIKPFKCSYCQGAFLRNSRKNLHERTCYKSGVSNKPKDYKYKCTFCPRKLETQKQLNDHENTHTGNRPHQCRVCNKAFASHNTLVSHVKLHADDKRHKCSICEKKFARNAELEHHTREKHLPDNDPRRYFPCLLCDVKLKSYCQYKRHSRKHRAILHIFTCDYCQEKFVRKDIIAQHMKIHSAIMPTCNYCQKRFGYTSSKNKHEQTCTKRSFPKDTRKIGFESRFCCKTLNARDELKNNENNHTGRPHQ